MLINEIIVKETKKPVLREAPKDVFKGKDLSTTDYLTVHPNGQRYKWSFRQGRFVHESGSVVPVGSKLEKQLFKVLGFTTSLFGRKPKVKNVSKFRQWIRKTTGQATLPAEAGVVQKLTTGVFAVSGRVITMIGVKIPGWILKGLWKVAFGIVAFPFKLISNAMYLVKDTYGKDDEEKPKDKPKPKPDDDIPDDFNPNTPQPKKQGPYHKYTAGTIVHYYKPGTNTPIIATVVKYPPVVNGKLDKNRMLINSGGEDFLINLTDINPVRPKKKSTINTDQDSPQPQPKNRTTINQNDLPNEPFGT